MRRLNFIKEFMQINSQVLSQYYNYTNSALRIVSEALHVQYPFQYAWAVALIIAIIVFLVILSIIDSLYIYVMSWAERKLMARMQSRHGPTYVGKFGFLQNFADLVKLLAKENIIPDNAEKIFPAVVPAIFALLFFILIFIPLSRGFVGINASLGLIIVFALLSFMPFLMFLVAWSSGNKFSSISAQRSVLMMVGYEIPMLLSLVPIVALSGGFEFYSIVTAQSAHWFILLMPIGFIVFFITLLAELERQPFDLREADSELIAGWLNDVSAPYYALVLFIDYTRMFIGTLLISILFLGGWIGPAFLPPAAWLIVKVILLTLFIVIIRATMIRMRIDKIMKFGWNWLLPLSVLNLLITFVLFIK